MIQEKTDLFANIFVLGKEYFNLLCKHYSALEYPRSKIRSGNNVVTVKPFIRRDYVEVTVSISSKTIIFA